MDTNKLSSLLYSAIGMNDGDCLEIGNQWEDLSIVVNFDDETNEQSFSVMDAHRRSTIFRSPSLIAALERALNELADYEAGRACGEPSAVELKAHDPGEWTRRQKLASAYDGPVVEGGK